MSAVDGKKIFEELALFASLLGLTASAAVAAPKRAGSALETLSRGDITRGMASVRHQVAACPSKTGGLVKVRVEVAPSGRVTSAVAAPGRDAAMARCVARTVRGIRFKATRRGRAFTYPVVIRDPRRLPTTSQLLAHVRRRYMGDIRRCHHAHTTAAGHVRMKLRIAPSGHTAPASVKGFDPRMDRCIWRAIHRWRIPGMYETASYELTIAMPGRRR